MGSFSNKKCFYHCWALSPVVATFSTITTIINQHLLLGEMQVHVPLRVHRINTSSQSFIMFVVLLSGTFLVCVFSSLTLTFSYSSGRLVHIFSQVISKSYHFSCACITLYITWAELCLEATLLMNRVVYIEGCVFI